MNEHDDHLEPEPVTAAAGDDEELLLPSSRVESFSDAVFAIAATLLVLSIAVPATTTDATLGHALRRDALPHVVSYAISFAVIGQFWLGHHRLMGALARVDQSFVMVNLLLLGLVAVMPFPTALLGQFGTSLAVSLYAANMAAAAFASTALSMIAARHGLYASTVGAAHRRRGKWRSAVPAIVFTLSIPLAIWVGPGVAELSWLLLLAARPLVNRLPPKP